MASCLQDLSKRLDTSLRTHLFDLGLKVAHNPWRVILLSLLFVALCSLGLLNFSIENDGEDLYTPSNARSKRDEKTVVELWGHGTRRVTVFGEEPAGNALTTDHLLDLLAVLELIRNHTIVYSGVEYSHADLCYRLKGQCAKSSVLDLFAYDAAQISASNTSDILSRINQPNPRDQSGRGLNVIALLGGVTRDANNSITSARALTLDVELMESPFEKGGDLKDWVAREWEVTLADKVLSLQLDHLTLYFYSDGARRVISNEALANDAALIPTGYLLLLVYAMLILGRRNILHSQSLLAVGSVLCVFLATFAAFSLASAFLDFSLVVQGSIFLLLGIGIDDTFVIINAFLLTDPTLPDDERVAAALAHAGSAITVTSITDFCAFVAGSFSAIPAIQVFCLYSAVGILFDFLLQITLFIAFLTLDLRRQSRQRADCLCCFHAPTSELDCITGRPFDTKSRGAVSEAISTGLSRTVLSPVGRVLVCALSVFLFAGGLYGALELRREFSFDWMIPEGNYIRDVIDFRRKYFAEVNEIEEQTFYAIGTDHYGAQSELNSLASAIPDIPYVLPDTTINWFTAYQQYLGDNAITPSNNTDFATHLLNFLETEAGSVYSTFVQFSADNSTVTTSYILCLFSQLTSETVIATMDASRALSDSITGIEIVPYSRMYVFMEGVKLMKDELIQNLMLAGAAVLCISTLLVANVWLGFLIGVMVIAIDVELLGWAYYLDLTYNSATVIISLVAVGIAVDYNVHLAHGFMNSHKPTRVERAREAIQVMAGTVVSGAVSTFLAVAMLGTSDSYVFRVFFKMVAGMVLLALFHGVCTLPVLLSFVGPRAFQNDMHGSFDANLKSPRSQPEVRGDVAEVPHWGDAAEKKDPLEGNGL